MYNQYIMIGVALISVLIYIYIITQTVKKVKKDVSKKFLDSKKEELIKEAEAEAKAAADAKRISLENEYRTLEQSYKDQINRTKNEINYLEQNRNNIINHEKETIKFAIDSYKKAEETKIEYEINQKRNGINDGCNKWTRHNGRVKANPLCQNRQCASYNLCNYNY